MNDTSIILLLAFLAGLIAVMTPILKLNSAITKLNITIDTLPTGLGGGTMPLPNMLYLGIK